MSSIFWLLGRLRCYLQVDCFGSDSMLFWKVCCTKYKQRSLVMWEGSISEKDRGF